ncbi:hypothetical protein [Mycoplasmopsis iners]|uniref:hypothetical protein n=1 Tax=Mycoplasmopsis iners TaxID=76630 RepID=UPI000495292E|nr:hypothetical protein [Mycoplasmopsis iners]
MKRNWKKLSLLGVSLSAALVPILTTSLAVPKNYLKYRGQENIYEGYRKTAYADFSNWMSDISDNKKLTQLSIPGTHDSAMYDYKGAAGFFGFAWAQTQVWDFSEQLKAGIRFFDLRLMGFDGNLALAHGAVYANIHFNNVMQKFKEFLAAHPRETIIIRIKEENVDPSKYSANDRRNWINKVMAVMDSYRSIMFDYLDKPDSYVPTLGEARGKVLVFNNFHHLFNPSRKYGPLFNAWTDTMFVVQDNYNVENADLKLAYWKSQFEFSEQELENGAFFSINFLSWANGNKPWDNALSTMPKAYRYLKEHPELRSLGIIPMDYPGQSFIEEILKRNYTWTDKQLAWGQYKPIIDVRPIAPKSGDYELTWYNQNLDDFYMDVKIERANEQGRLNQIYQESNISLRGKNKIVLPNNLMLDINDKVTVKFYRYTEASIYYEADKFNVQEKVYTVNQYNEWRQKIFNAKNDINETLTKNIHYPEIATIIHKELNDFKKALDLYWNTIPTENLRNGCAIMIERINFIKNNLISIINSIKNQFNQFRLEESGKDIYQDNSFATKLPILLDEMENYGISQAVKILNETAKNNWNNTMLVNIVENFNKHKNDLVSIFQSLNQYKTLNLDNLKRIISNNEDYLLSFKNYLSQIYSNNTIDVEQTLSELNIDNLASETSRIQTAISKLIETENEVVKFETLITKINNLKSKTNELISTNAFTDFNFLVDNESLLNYYLDQISLLIDDFGNNKDRINETNYQNRLRQFITLINNNQSILNAESQKEEYSYIKNYLKEKISSIELINSSNFDSFDILNLANKLFEIESILKSNGKLRNYFKLKELIVEVQNLIDNKHYSPSAEVTLNEKIKEIEQIFTNNSLNETNQTIDKLLVDTSLLNSIIDEYQELLNLKDTSELNLKHLQDQVLNLKNELEPKISQLNSSYGKWTNIIKNYFNNHNTHTSEDVSLLKSEIIGLNKIKTYFENEDNLTEIQKANDLINKALSNSISFDESDSVLSLVSNEIAKDFPNLAILQSKNIELANEIDYKIEQNELKQWIANNKMPIVDAQTIKQNNPESLFVEINDLTETYNKIANINQQTTNEELKTLKAKIVELSLIVEEYKQMIPLLPKIKANNEILNSFSNEIQKSHYDAFRDEYNSLKSEYDSTVANRTFNTLNTYFIDQSELITKIQKAKNDFENSKKTISMTFVNQIDKTEIKTIQLEISNTGEYVDLTKHFDKSQYQLMGSENNNIIFVDGDCSILLIPIHRIIKLIFINAEDNATLLEKSVDVNNSDNYYEFNHLIPSGYILNENQSESIYITQRSEYTISLVPEFRIVQLHFVDQNQQVINKSRKAVKYFTKNVDISSALPENYHLINNLSTIREIAEVIKIEIAINTRTITLSFYENDNEISNQEVEIPVTQSTLNIESYVPQGYIKTADQSAELSLNNDLNYTIKVRNLIQRVELVFDYPGTDIEQTSRVLELPYDQETIDIKQYIPENYHLQNADDAIQNVQKRIVVNLAKNTKNATINFMFGHDKIDSHEIIVPFDQTQINVRDLIPSGYELVEANEMINIEENTIVNIVPINKDIKLIFLDDANSESLKEISLTLPYKQSQLDISQYLPENYTIDNSIINLDYSTINIRVKVVMIDIIITYKTAQNETINVVNLSLPKTQKTINVAQYVPQYYKLVNENSYVKIADSIDVVVENSIRTINLRFIHYGNLIATKSLNIVEEQKVVKLTDYQNLIPENYIKANNGLTSDILVDEQEEYNVSVVPQKRTLTINYQTEDNRVIKSTRVEIDYYQEELSILEWCPESYHLVNLDNVNVANVDSYDAIVKLNEKSAMINYVFENQIILSYKLNLSANDNEINVANYVPNGYKLLNDSTKIYPYSAQLTVKIVPTSKIILLNFVNNNNLIKEQSVELAYETAELDITQYIPNNYHLIGSASNILNLDSESIIINIEKDQKNLEIIFKDADNNLTVVQTNNEQVDFDINSYNINNLIPGGYMLNDNVNSNLTLTNDKKQSFNIEVIKSSKTINVKLVDETNQIVNEQTISLPRKQATYLAAHLITSDYLLAENQNTVINLTNELNQNIEIKVVKAQRTVNLTLKDVDTNEIIKTTEIAVPRIQKTIDLADYLPENYEFINNQTIYAVNDVLEVSIQSKNQKVILVFVDSKNQQIKTVEVKVALNSSTIDIANYIPEGYSYNGDTNIQMANAGHIEVYKQNDETIDESGNNTKQITNTNSKKIWIPIVVGSTLISGGLAWLIYFLVKRRKIKAS